ncbi:MAG: exported protein of unknown function [Patescibacteria group bacterium]|nr:exported protein of unknown function [Patescibacteria group bacterium]
MTKTATTFLRRPSAILIGGSMAAVLAFAAPVAQAAESQGFQISPPVTELKLDPGTSARGVVKVTNLTDQQITLQVSKQNFVARGEEGEVDLLDNGDALYSLSPWFTIGQASVDVPPKSTKEVPYILNVPPNAEPGGRYGSIIFDTIPPKLPSGQSGATVKQRLAGLIFLRVNGNANEQLAVTTFQPNHTFYEYGPINFMTRIKNLGTVHEKPTGQIVIKNVFGFKTATIKLDEKNVIPSATRKLTSTFKRRMMVGPYTAELTVHNGAKQTLTAKTSFTVIPYKLVAGVLFVLTLLVLFYWKSRKRFARAFRILAGRE